MNVEGGCCTGYGFDGPSKPAQSTHLRLILSKQQDGNNFFAWTIIKFGSCIGHRNSGKRMPSTKRMKTVILCERSSTLLPLTAFDVFNDNNNKRQHQDDQQYLVNKKTYSNVARAKISPYLCSLGLLKQASEMRYLILKPETVLKHLHEDKTAQVSTFSTKNNYALISSLLTICPLVAAYKTAIMDVAMSECDNLSIKRRLIIKRRCGTAYVSQYLISYGIARITYTAQCIQCMYIILYCESDSCCNTIERLDSNIMCI
uniref:Uncharacterized protein n=1 Tax=Glossina palpalis gambiensis TaxID=67801 RepID=A0A1B0BG11_9MUSC